jgi:hypothetical protein
MDVDDDDDDGSGGGGGSGGSRTGGSGGSRSGGSGGTGTGGSGGSGSGGSGGGGSAGTGGSGGSAGSGGSGGSAGSGGSGGSQDAGGGDKPQADSAPVSAVPFTDIQAILVMNCYTGCHDSTNMRGGFRVSNSTPATTYMNLLGMGMCMMPRVVPDKPDDSLIIKKIDRTKYPMPPCGEPMPRGRDPLSAADIAKVRDWIAGGAKGP